MKINTSISNKLALKRSDPNYDPKFSPKCEIVNLANRKKLILSSTSGIIGNC